MLTIKNKGHTLVTLLCLVPTLSAHAATWLGASLAASNASLGNSAPRISYFSGDTITDTYPPSHSRTTRAAFGINGGYEWAPTVASARLSLGLGLYRNASRYPFSGSVFEAAAGDPGSTLYDYHYKASSTRIMAEGQATWLVGTWMPFVNLGIGPAINRFSGYDETGINDNSYPPLPAFQSHNSTRFAWQAGLGAGIALGHGRLNAGYRYVNAGKTSFGTRGPDYPWRLNTGTLSTNDLYLAYIWLF